MRINDSVLSSQSSINNKPEDTFEVTSTRQLAQQDTASSQNMLSAGKVGQGSYSNRASNPPVSPQLSPSNSNIYEKISQLPPELKSQIGEYVFNTHNISELDNVIGNQFNSSFLRFAGEQGLADDKLSFNPVADGTYAHKEIGTEFHPPMAKPTVRFNSTDYSHPAIDPALHAGQMAVKLLAHKRSVLSDTNARVTHDMRLRTVSRGVSNFQPSPAFRAIARRYSAGLDRAQKTLSNPFNLAFAGDAALLHAVETNNPSAVTRLKVAGYDMTGETGMAALKIALEKDNTHVVRELLKAGVNVTGDEGYDLLKGAIRKNNSGIVDLFLKNGVDITGPRNDEVLMIATKKSDSSALIRLVSAGANVSGPAGYEALKMAAETGQQFLITKLNTAGLRITSDQQTEVLGLAAQHGNQHVSTELLKMPLFSEA